MKRLLSISVLCFFLACLGGCVYVYEYVPALEPVKSYSDFPLTSSGFWEFVDYCQRHWEWEKDLPGELCQDPFVTQNRLRGDCDDFACMIAYFAQEYWPYDSRIYHLSMNTGSYHMVAAVRVAYDTISWYYDKNDCNSDRMYFYSDTSPSRTYYLPLDQSQCLWYGANDCDTIGVVEWGEIVGTPLSLLDRPTSGNPGLELVRVGECP